MEYGYVISSHLNSDRRLDPNLNKLGEISFRMTENEPKLFDCPAFAQGKYCHALCNYRHQTEEERRASKSSSSKRKSIGPSYDPF